jgi:hypothetical protein
VSPTWQRLHRSDCCKRLNSLEQINLSWNPRKTINQNCANPSPKGHTGTCSTIPQCEHVSPLSQDGNPLKSRTCFGKHVWLNCRGRSNCASRNCRTYVALVGRLFGWLVASFIRCCLVGWSHFSLSRPVCHRHGKHTCHVPSYSQTVKLNSFRIHSISKLGFLFSVLAIKRDYAISVLI